MSIVCLHYFTLKWASSGGGGRIGESFNGDRVSVWGDESLLEMDSGNDCNVNKHVMLLKVVKMVNLMSCVCAPALAAQSYTRLSANPWTAARQAPLSMGFSRQEYWTGLTFSSPGGLPDPGIEPRPPELQADFFVFTV